MCIQLLFLLCCCFAGGIVYPLPDETVWLQMHFQQMQFWEASATILGMAMSTDGSSTLPQGLFCRSCSAGGYIKWCAGLSCSTDSLFLGNVTKQKVVLTLPDDFLFVLLVFFFYAIFLNILTTNLKIVNDNDKQFCILAPCWAKYADLDIKPHQGLNFHPTRQSVSLLNL